MPPPTLTQSPEQIAATIRAFLDLHPRSTLLEDGRLLFDLADARHTLSTDHNHCTLHLWSEAHNLTRHLLSATPRNSTLRLQTQRFGAPRPSTLELVSDPTRRTPSTRESTRTRFLHALPRILQRNLPELKPETFTTSIDLKRSFGPAFARGTLVRGQQAWAVIAINADESQATIDAILTTGLLWLDHCRTLATHTSPTRPRRHLHGLKLILPSGTTATTLSRLSWLNSDLAQFHLYELDPRSEDLTRLDPTDHGNLHTRLHHAPNLAAAHARFAEAIPLVLSLLPAATPIHGLDQPLHQPGLDQTSQPSGLDHTFHPASNLIPYAAHRRTPLHPSIPACELRLRSSNHLAFLLHGLEFARIRQGYAGQTFNRQLEITVGASPSETPLTPTSAPHLRRLVHELFDRRRAHPISSLTPDPLFRIQPERWLESLLRRHLPNLDASLAPSPVYTQVPAFTGAGAHADRGMLDLLAITTTSRLALIELKVEEDLQLALQALDYWIRVRHHHRTHPDAIATLGDLQQHGYFPGQRLSPRDPVLYLVAPALHIHPATETLLRYLSPAIEWHLIAIDERWRTGIRPVWRKRSPTPATQALA